MSSRVALFGGPFSDVWQPRPSNTSQLKHGWDDTKSSFGGSSGGDSEKGRHDSSPSSPFGLNGSDSSTDGDYGHHEDAVRNGGEASFESGFSSRCSLEQPPASLQPKLLKQINSFNAKEDILNLVATCGHLLDPINLVTCVYRLARMYATVRNPAARNRWSAELRTNMSFLQLIGTIQGHMLQAQLELIDKGCFKGLDAQCVSNLIWAMIKLDVSSDPSSPGYELVKNASPLVMYFLSSSSSQGLANLLWAYSKVTVPLLDVMMMIVGEMAGRLHSPEGIVHFDAQALSNSIWALAHMRSRPADLDAVANSPGLTMHFLFGIAFCALNMLRGLRTRSDLMHMQASMVHAEKRFSCQALVNICWSLASMLGEDCSKILGIRSLFTSIRSEALVRLRATSSALQLKQAWVLRLQGGFNEQALSNIVYAFDRAQLLDRDLLQSVFTVAGMRLDSTLTGQRNPAFKPQELCTLLRAAQSDIAQPWGFLGKLADAVAASPYAFESWSGPERAELQRALALLDMYRTTLMLQQLQVMQQQQLAPSPQQALAAQLAALSLSPPLWDQPSSSLMQQQVCKQQLAPGNGPAYPSGLGFNASAGFNQGQLPARFFGY